MITDMQYSFKKKMMAWILSICLVVTLIPEFTLAVTENSGDEKIAPEEVTQQNVIEKTETTTTYDLGGGEEMAVFHGGEVRFKNEEGKLVDYDPSLVSIEDGEKTDNNIPLTGYSYRNNEGDKKQYLPEKLSEDTPVLMEKDEYRISLTMTDETISKASLTNSEISIEEERIPSIYEGEETLPINAVYGDEDDDINVMYTSGEHGIKETITLNERPAANIFKYSIDIGSLKIKKNVTDEGLTIYDEETDDIVASIDAPWMNDATGNKYSEDITYTLEKDGEEEGKYTLIMTVSEEYLKNPETVYPVVIDPTATWKGDSKLRDVYVISGSYAGTNFYESGTRVMPIGKNSTGTHRTYMQIVGLKAAVKGQSISSAKLTLYETGNGVGNKIIRANRITENWTASKLTWNNKPSYNTSAYMAQVTTSGTAKKAKTFNIISFVKNVAGSTSNYGIVFRNVSDTPSYTEFYGSRTTLTSYRPKLVVTYYSVPTLATSANVSPSYIKQGQTAKLTFSGITSTGLARNEFKIRTYDDINKANIAVVEGYSYGEANSIKSGGSLPVLDEGCYRVSVRGVNKAGVAGEGKYASNILHVDSTNPAFANATLKDNKENEADRISIDGSATTETNPIIGFEGVEDKHLDKASAISYTITETGKKVEGSAQYKIPTNISISDTAPYSGRFYLNEEDRNLPSGKYDIHVKVTDRAGNNTSKIVSYFLDKDDPTGTINIKDVAGVDVTTLTGNVSIVCEMDGTGSELVTKTLKLYKTKQTDEDPVIDGEAVYTVAYADAIEPLDTTDHCKENGTYRFVLDLKDEVGRTAQITKDVTIDNTFAKPSISINDTKGTTSALTWSFSQITSLTKIQYRFDDSDQWQEITAASGSGLTGSTQITVPEAEGQHTIYVKGTNENGLVSKTASAAFDVDRTVPEVQIDDFRQGYLLGTVSDTSLKTWNIYAKEKTADSFDGQPIVSASRTVSEGEIAFIDLTDERFKVGQEYTIKIEAEDEAGNTAYDSFDVVVQNADTLAYKIPSSFRILRNNNQEYSDPVFIVATSEDRFELSDETAASLSWYIDNSKAAGADLKNDEGGLLYEETVEHDIVVVNKDSEGQRHYSLPVIRNGALQDITLADSDIQSGEYIKTVSAGKDAVSLRFSDIPENAAAYIKTGDGNYTQVNNQDTYYVDELTADNVHADTFTLKVVAAGGANITGAQINIYFDTVVNESFIISEAEKYLPTGFTVKDKINYKTYFNWDVPEDLPENIYYELYRGTTPDFEASEETLIDGSLRDGYYAEMNIEYRSTFYYKIRAVKKDDKGNVIQRSTFAAMQASTVADETEYMKRLGFKEYWEFADFTTPAGEGAIEKSKGNFVYTQVDAVIPNEGLEVNLTRAYNSQSSVEGAFGLGWTHDYDLELLALGEEDANYDNVVLKDGTGTMFQFIRNAAGDKYLSSMGEYINLQRVDIDAKKIVKIPEAKIGVATGSDPLKTIELPYKFLLSTNDGIEYYFNSSGKLILVTEANDNFILFDHDGRGRLIEMRTNKNIVMGFTYNASEEDDGLLVRSVTLPDGSSVDYGYDNTTFSGYDILATVKVNPPSDSEEAKQKESILYEYNYSNTVFDFKAPNLKEIRDAEFADDNTGKYEIDYGSQDKAKAVIYPNGDKFTLDYKGAVEGTDYTKTITKKFSDGKEVHGEMDLFDKTDGRVVKTIAGVEDIDNLDQYDESQLDVTEYAYNSARYDEDSENIRYFLKATTTTVEKDYVDSDGFIVRTSEKKTDTIDSFNEFDDPTKETESDGTTSEYTYYTDSETSSEQKAIVGLVKSILEKTKDGKVLVHEEYKYDNNGNITEIDDKVNEVIITRAYYAEDSASGLKGELKSEVETMKDGNTTVGQSTLNYTYEYYEKDNQIFKKEICSQAIDGKTISVETIYDSMGREVYEKDTRDFSRSTSYDGFGRPKEIKYEYSGVGTKDNQDTETTAKSYDKNGLVINETLEDGTYKEYDYDSLDRVISTKVARGSETVEILTTYDYEDVHIFTGKGSETREVKNAFVTTRLYPAEDGTSDTQQIISKTYEDSFGRTVRTYQNGMYTDMTYNMQGDMVTKLSLGSTLEPADGLLEVYVYDDNGNLTDIITNPGYQEKAGTTGFFAAEDSIRTTAEYDKSGNITYQTDPLGNKTGYGYDDKGRLSSVTLPGEVKGTLSTLKYQYTYDEDNGYYLDEDDNTLIPTTKDTVEDPKGNKSIVVTDYLDQTLQVADLGSADAVGENSIATSYDYDIKGNLIKATEKEGNYKKYSYDSHDRVTAIEYFKANDSRELKTEFIYDSSDNLLSMKDYKYSSGKYTLYRYTGYEYDDFNRLISVSECDTAAMPTDDELEANKIRYEYDSRDNLIGIKYPTSDMKVAGIVLTYNKITGLVTKAEAVTEYDNDTKEPVSKITIREYSYNHMNQVLEIKDYTDFLNDTSKYMIRSYGYDDLGRPVSIEYTDNMSISSSDIKQAHYYTYDKNCNIIEERIINKYGQANGAVPEETRSYEYDQHGRIVSTSIEKMGEAEEFDEETGEAVTGTDNTYIEQIAYEYDAAGNRTKITKNGEETDYSYNGYNQLTSAVTKKLAEGVEGSDEGTEQTEGSPSAAAEDIISSKTYTYDKNGNQLTEADSKKNTATAFRYDADNRLTYAQGKTGDTVEYTQENEYNGFGQRILKKEGTEETNYFYDGTQVLYTEDREGVRTSFNIIGAEDNILTTARFEGDVTSFYTYTKDLRESTINLIGSDGTAAVSYEYDDFGETTEYQANAGNPFYNEVCYSGGIYDDTTGLYYLNARYYDPADAIFLTQDTHRGNRSRTYTLNYYAYCAGNPISYTDPSGHAIWGVVGAAMGAYDGYKYAKKKKLKGWKKAAAIAGGALLGVVNPFKVVKGASKAGKIVKGAVKKAKSLKNDKKASKVPVVTKGKGNKGKAKTKELNNSKNNNADNRQLKKASNSTCDSPKVNTSWYKEDGSKNYPPFDGAMLGTEEVITLKAGTKLGRYGQIRTNSKYVTDVTCSPDELSLPPWTDSKEYRELIVKSDIHNVTKSRVAPWGDSPGGGTQYMLPKSIMDLIKEGVLGFA